MARRGRPRPERASIGLRAALPCRGGQANAAGQWLGDVEGEDG